MGATAAAAEAKKGSDGQDVQTPTVIIPFTRAAKETERPFFDVSQAIGSAQVQLGPFDLPATGYFRWIELLVEATGGDGSTTNAVAQEDAPWSVLQQVTTVDTTGKNLISPYTGFDLYLAVKWGGYDFEGDLELHPDFADVDTNGDFTFVLVIPQEITAWDALGALPNQDQSAPFKLDMSIAADTLVYSTNPADAGGDALPTVRVRGWLYGWTQPPATDLRGRPQATTPPANGTTQFWSKQPVDVEAGDQRLRFKRVGKLIRNLILVYRDDASPRVRTTAEFPDPIQLEIDGRTIRNVSRTLLRGQLRRRYGQDPDVGVFVFDFIHDRDHHPGNEHRDLYLATHPGTNMELVGNFGGTGGQLTVLTNDVAPASDLFDLEA